MEISELIKIEQLPTLPDTFYRLSAAIKDENVSFSEIGEIISLDPALTVHLLKVVNSSFYGFSSQIDTVSHALSVIGTEQLTQLVLATMVMGRFRQIPGGLMDLRAFWQHSIGCGLAARSIAVLGGHSNVERFFVAGLLHDIGRLVMCLKTPALFRQALEFSRKSGDRLYKSEAKCFGFDHSMVGGSLLKAWNLPEFFEFTTTYHHRPLVAEKYTQEAAIIHLADAIAHANQVGEDDERDRVFSDPDIWTFIQLNEARCLPVIKEKINGQFEGVSQVFLQAA